MSYNEMFLQLKILQRKRRVGHKGDGKIANGGKRGGTVRKQLVAIEATSWTQLSWTVRDSLTLLDSVISVV